MALAGGVDLLGTSAKPATVGRLEKLIGHYTPPGAPGSGAP